MAKRRPLWPVRYPTESAKFSFFISHVREDEADALELKRALEVASLQIAGTVLPTFLDKSDWPDGRPNMEVIREHLFQSQQMVAWITPAYLQSPRGWVWVELTYAHLLELSLNEKVPRETTLQFVVPIFRGVTLTEIERTPWIDFWSKRFMQLGANPSIPELAEHLVRFSLDESARRQRFA